jgi:hypothetical protein
MNEDGGLEGDEEREGRLEERGSSITKYYEEQLLLTVTAKVAADKLVSSEVEQEDAVERLIGSEGKKEKKRLVHKIRWTVRRNVRKK